MAATTTPLEGHNEDGDRPRLSAKDRAMVAIAPIVLLAVAAVAIVRYHTVDQSSWQGFGFGMFATWEDAPARDLQITVFQDGEPEPMAIPADLLEQRHRVLTAPGDAETGQLARQLLERTGADAVQIDVVGRDADAEGDGLRIGLKVLRTVRVP